MRIELTNEVVKAITMTCPYLNTDLRNCKQKCALNGACLEYWTGDNSLNNDPNWPVPCEEEEEDED